MQFQEKLTIQTQENGKKPYFGPDLGSLDPNSNRQIFFKKMASSENLVADGQTNR